MLSKVIVIGPLQVNCYLVGCQRTRHVMILDPGDDADRIISVIESEKLIPQSIIATHGHLDHVGDVKSLQDRLNLPFYIHSNEIPLIDTLPAQASAFGLHLSGIPKVIGYLEHEQAIDVGDQRFVVLHTPGHSPGGICLKSESCVFSGDTLFAGSVGRCDLPGGDWDQLLRSIRTQLMTLPDPMTVHPGHGPLTSIGRERKLNPYLRDS